MAESQRSQHRLGQYAGEYSVIADRRPKTWIRRAASEDEDEARAREVDAILARRWLDAEPGRLARVCEALGHEVSKFEAVKWLAGMEAGKRREWKERIG